MQFKLQEYSAKIFVATCDQFHVMKYLAPISIWPGRLERDAAIEILCIYVSQEHQE